MSFFRPSNRLIAAALAVMVLTACTGRSGQPPEAPAGDLSHIDPSGQVITFWHPYSGHREEVLSALLDEFNASNPWCITVLGESAGSTVALYRAIDARIEAGLLPDLTIAAPYQVATYVDRGVLVELTPYVEHRAWGLTQSEREDFVAVSVLPQFEGLYSLPASRSVEVLYYNQDLLYELGYTEPPRTWDAFREMACAAASAGAGGYAFSVDAVTFVDMLANRGGQMLEEGARGYAFGNESGLETLTFIRSLLADGCATWVVEQEGDGAAFSSGRVLFIVDSTASLPAVHAAVAAGSSFDWSIVALPTTLETPRVAIYGLDYVIPRTTPERQLAAWLLVKWLSMPQQQARWVQAVYTLPTRATTVVLLDDEVWQDAHYQAALGFLGGELVAEPAVTGYERCRRQLEGLLRDVAEGAEPAPGLVGVVRACNQSLGITAP